ncbi:Ig-like domain-containing protein [Butyrivibrio sp. AC2005]|uniref:Ig-like domain-containing protein n=1 Tax=Butyrivibrio sp. AC2005 TaxID=1280672 RepID=UPI00041B6C5B|nr:Ig-like domain-containing protein [Butyrivibrio sp. AC2005]
MNNKKLNIKKILMCLALALMLTGTCAVTIPQFTMTASAKAKISKKKIEIKPGKTKKIKMSGIKGASVKWSSSNKKVATVDQNGKVKAKKAGQATIKAKVNGKTYKCKVCVLCKSHKYEEETKGTPTKGNPVDKVLKCTVCGHEENHGKKYWTPSEAEIQASLAELRQRYPERTPLVNIPGCQPATCQGWVELVQNHVFGNLEGMRRVYNYDLSKLKVGDAIVYQAWQALHIVFVTEVNGNEIMATEGNPTTLWDTQYRIISNSTIMQYNHCILYNDDGSISKVWNEIDTLNDPTNFEVRYVETYFDNQPE